MARWQSGGTKAPASLADVERRRRQLWAVAGFFLLAVSAVAFLALTDTELAQYVPDVAALRWGFVALAVAFMLHVADQERMLRRLTHTLVEQSAVTASLEARVSDLTTLTKVGRLVNSVLTVGEVVDSILEAAFELTRARNGSVLLRAGETLRVVASTGPQRAPLGARTVLGAEVAGEVAASGVPRVVDGHAPDRAGERDRRRPEGSSAVVPLIGPDGAVGVLALERGPDLPSFTELELRSIALFAEHAGTAIANAMRYEGERDTAVRLADVLELRSEFVATMVHDLKSPLTAIVGYANILRRQWERLNEGQRDRALESVERQADRLLELVEEVLRSTSIEAGAELRRDPVDLAAMLRDLAETVRSGAAGRERVVREVSVDCQDPTVVHGDDEALRHVFSNLLENAVKYSSVGSPVRVRVRGGDDEVHVEVADVGQGIPAEDIDGIFERFRQSSATRRSGVGLGLYIVRTLVSAHGGEVSVSSVEGAGSTFTVRLPVHVPDEVELPEGRAPIAVAEQADA